MYVDRYYFVLSLVDNQSQTMLKPKPCANRPATKVARQKSASDEESRCRGNVCEEGKYAFGK